MHSDLVKHLSGFESATWEDCGTLTVPAAACHVYLLTAQKGSLTFPLYAGLTKRLLGRIGDYQASYFSAPTDFRVGEAICDLGLQGCLIRLWYKEAPNHAEDERSLIRGPLLSGFHLLNFLPAFAYEQTTQAVERSIIKAFCSMLLAQAAVKHRSEFSADNLAR